MDNTEARQILRRHLDRLRNRSYGELRNMIRAPEVFEEVGPSGTQYQIEIEVFWDDQPGGALRVLGGIDDGGWRAFKPLSDDFIMAPDGAFLDE